MGWGDELMAAGEVSKVYDGEPVAILGNPKGSPRSHAAWENNPQIQKPNQSYKKFIVNGPGHRPYVQSVSNSRWFWKPYKPIPAPIYFTAEELRFAQSIEEGFIALEPHPKDKQEAVNRDWGWDKWVELAGLLSDQRVVQFGVKGTKILPGVEHIVTNTPRLMAAALGRAKGFVSTEGGFHHTAGAMKVKGVVIYGHYNSPMVTGYDMHHHIYDSGLGCGSRVKCPKCKEFMQNLSAKRVNDALRQILNLKGNENG
jgi:ADP-heptose:LPS heptosyltransferase